MQYARIVCVCVWGGEGLGVRSFLDLTDRNFGAVFWQCFLFFLRRQYFQMKLIFKFFGPSLQFPCESNFLHRVGWCGIQILRKILLKETNCAK